MKTTAAERYAPLLPRKHQKWLRSNSRRIGTCGVWDFTE